MTGFRQGTCPARRCLVSASMLFLKGTPQVVEIPHLDGSLARGCNSCCAVLLQRVTLSVMSTGLHDHAGLGFHSWDGSAFLGVRLLASGLREVVYDDTSGTRVVVAITDRTAEHDHILDAVRDGIAHKNPLRGVLQALNARNIRFDCPPPLSRRPAA